MLTIEIFIKRLFPDGTNLPEHGAEADHDTVPQWPPDLFAVAASLIERSGCYSHPRFAGGDWGTAFHEDDYPSKISAVARAWMDISEQEMDQPVTNVLIDELQKRWSSLSACADSIDPCSASKPAPAWCDDAMWLLAVADEASAGIGFLRSYNSNQNIRYNPFVKYWIRQYMIWDVIVFLKKNINNPLSDEEKAELRATIEAISWESDSPVDLVDDLPALKDVFDEALELTYLTSSLCKMVPRVEVCVQPKTRTSNVGCTLRSLSHHLAVLPPASQVETRWRVANEYCASEDEPSGPQALNLLLVPFPYTIAGNCFEWGTSCVGSHRGDWNADGVNRARFFSLQQRWLRCSDDSAKQISSLQMSSFLCDLISIAKNEVDEIHGIILPELALTSDLADGVAENLSKNTSIEFFISGVSTEAGDGRGPRNSVYTCFIKSDHKSNHAITWANRSWEQAKHHRWKLEKYQIRRYHLGGRLDPHIDWWEHIDISPRQCYFGAIRHEACLTALICEDLARIDPVQTVIRSIGPNLVVALLMDGPQIESRWSGRYATVLADDPGCAVLTLTSLGLLKRSHTSDKKPPCQIGLWKEAGGEKATELEMPLDHHGMVLTLSYKMDDVFTMDGRPDITKTVTLSRSGILPLKLPRVPAWLQ